MSGVSRWLSALASRLIPRVIRDHNKDKRALRARVAAQREAEHLAAKEGLDRNARDFALDTEE